MKTLVPRATATVAFATLFLSGTAALAAGPPPQAAAQQVQTDAAVIADLVDGNRILAGLGILDSYGHVSARSPTHPDHFFMARAIAPGVVTAADILEFDANGEPVSPTSAKLYAERYLHAAAYRARPEIKAVDHDHAASSIPFGITNTPLRAVTHDGAFIGEGVPVFDADPDGSNGAMQVSSLALGAKMMAVMGQGNVLLIRGHGEVVTGRSIAEAISRAVNVDKNAKIEQAALALGGPIKWITPAETAGREALAARRPEFRDWDELKLRFGVHRAER
jgi:HCOMODA/2-hydroxy-3-carboxy-muconic semialdehyde decarboxylase